jgi:uncharacterized protein YmfQ (DUF2313 family)
MSFASTFAFYFGGEAVPTDEALIVRYQEVLQKLMPPGAALNRRAASNIGNWLRAFSVELARIDGRVSALYDEGYPGTATETLDVWEEICGLPDCTYELAMSTERRREAVLSHFAATEGQSESDFESIAAARGYVITIQIWDIFRTGVHTIGHMPIFSTPHYFAMNIAYAAQDPVSDAALECAIQKHAHAHTVVHFNLAVGPPDYFVTHPR